MRSIVPTMRWGRYGSSRDEAAVCEFPVIYFADILSKGFVIEELFYGWIYTEILIILRYIYSDFLIIARTYNRGKTIKIFSKPCKLLGVLGLAVFGDRPQLFHIHICAVDGGCKVVYLVNTSSAAISLKRSVHFSLSMQMSSRESSTSSGVGAPSRANALSMASSSQGKYRNSVFPLYSARKKQSISSYTYTYAGKFCPS